MLALGLGARYLMTSRDGIQPGVKVDKGKGQPQESRQLLTWPRET